MARRALITGGAGFIGSHLADRLLADGDAVVLLDDLSTGRLDNIEHLRHRPDVEFVVGSILDADLIGKLVGRCDIVYHLAAAVGVDLVVERPLESLRTNIAGSEIVLEAAHHHGTPVLVTSSSEIYGKNDSDLLRETDDRVLGSPLKTRWTYSEAKAIEEALAYTYHRETGLTTVIVRLFNTVGPRQTGRYGMVLPRFVQQAIRGEALTVHGDGAQSRCFCHVADIVDALPRLLDHPGAPGQAINLGSTEEITIQALAHRVIARTGSASSVRYVPYDEAYQEGFEDMPRRVPDITRARDLVGFAPRHGLDAIIDAVIEEHRR